MSSKEIKKLLQSSKHFDIFLLSSDDWRDSSTFFHPSHSRPECSRNGQEKNIETNQSKKRKGNEEEMTNEKERIFDVHFRLFFRWFFFRWLEQMPLRFHCGKFSIRHGIVNNKKPFSFFLSFSNNSNHSNTVEEWEISIVING